MDNSGDTSSTDQIDNQNQSSQSTESHTSLEYSSIPSTFTNSTISFTTEPNYYSHNEIPTMNDEIDSLDTISTNTSHPDNTLTNDLADQSTHITELFTTNTSNSQDTLNSLNSLNNTSNSDTIPANPTLLMDDLSLPITSSDSVLTNISINAATLPIESQEPVQTAATLLSSPLTSSQCLSTLEQSALQEIPLQKNIIELLPHLVSSDKLQLKDGQIPSLLFDPQTGQIYNKKSTFTRHPRVKARSKPEKVEFIPQISQNNAKNSEIGEDEKQLPTLHQLPSQSSIQASLREIDRLIGILEDNCDQLRAKEDELELNKIGKNQHMHELLSSTAFSSTNQYLHQLPQHSLTHPVDMDRNGHFPNDELNTTHSPSISTSQQTHYPSNLYPSQLQHQFHPSTKLQHTSSSSSSFSSLQHNQQLSSPHSQHTPSTSTSASSPTITDITYADPTNMTLSSQILSQPPAFLPNQINLSSAINLEYEKKYQNLAKFQHSEMLLPFLALSSQSHSIQHGYTVPHTNPHIPKHDKKSEYFFQNDEIDENDENNSSEKDEKNDEKSHHHLSDIDSFSHDTSTSSSIPSISTSADSNMSSNNQSKGPIGINYTSLYNSRPRLLPKSFHDSLHASSPSTLSSNDTTSDDDTSSHHHHHHHINHPSSDLPVPNTNTSITPLIPRTSRHILSQSHKRKMTSISPSTSTSNTHISPTQYKIRPIIIPNDDLLFDSAEIPSLTSTKNSLVNFDYLFNIPRDSRLEHVDNSQLLQQVISEPGLLFDLGTAVNYEERKLRDDLDQLEEAIQSSLDPSYNDQIDAHYALEPLNSDGLPPSAVSKNLLNLLGLGGVNMSQVKEDIFKNQYIRTLQTSTAWHETRRALERLYEKNKQLLLERKRHLLQLKYGQNDKDIIILGDVLGMIGTIQNGDNLGQHAENSQNSSNGSLESLENTSKGRKTAQFLTALSHPLGLSEEMFTGSSKDQLHIVDAKNSLLQPPMSQLLPTMTTASLISSPSEPSLPVFIDSMNADAKVPSKMNLSSASLQNSSSGGGLSGLVSSKSRRSDRFAAESTPQVIPTNSNQNPVIIHPSNVEATPYNHQQQIHELYRNKYDKQVRKMIFEASFIPLNHSGKYGEDGKLISFSTSPQNLLIATDATDAVHHGEKNQQQNEKNEKKGLNVEKTLHTAKHATLTALVQNSPPTEQYVRIPQRTANSVLFKRQKQRNKAETLASNLTALHTYSLPLPPLYFNDTQTYLPILNQIVTKLINENKSKLLFANGLTKDGKLVSSDGFRKNSKDSIASRATKQGSSMSTSGSQRRNKWKFGRAVPNTLPGALHGAQNNEENQQNHPKSSSLTTKSLLDKRLPNHLLSMTSIDNQPSIVHQRIQSLLYQEHRAHEELYKKAQNDIISTELSFQSLFLSNPSISLSNQSFNNYIQSEIENDYLCRQISHSQAVLGLLLAHIPYSSNKRTQMSRSGPNNAVHTGTAHWSSANRQNKRKTGQAASNSPQIDSSGALMHMDDISSDHNEDDLDRGKTGNRNVDFFESSNMNSMSLDDDTTSLMTSCEPQKGLIGETMGHSEGIDRIHERDAKTDKKRPKCDSKMFHIDPALLDYPNPVHITIPTANDGLDALKTWAYTHFQQQNRQNRQNGPNNQNRYNSSQSHSPILPYKPNMPHIDPNTMVPNGPPARIPSIYNPLIEISPQINPDEHFPLNSTTSRNIGPFSSASLQTILHLRATDHVKLPQTIYEYNSILNHNPAFNFSTTYYYNSIKSQQELSFMSPSERKQYLKEKYNHIYRLQAQKKALMHHLRLSPVHLPAQSTTVRSSNFAQSHQNTVNYNISGSGAAEGVINGNTTKLYNNSASLYKGPVNLDDCDYDNIYSSFGKSVYGQTGFGNQRRASTRANKAILNSTGKGTGSSARSGHNFNNFQDDDDLNHLGDYNDCDYTSNNTYDGLGIQESGSKGGKLGTNVTAHSKATNVSSTSTGMSAITGLTTASSHSHRDTDAYTYTASSNKASRAKKTIKNLLHSNLIGAPSLRDLTTTHAIKPLSKFEQQLILDTYMYDDELFISSSDDENGLYHDDDLDGHHKTRNKTGNQTSLLIPPHESISHQNDQNGAYLNHFDSLDHFQYNNNKSSSSNSGAAIPSVERTTQSLHEIIQSTQHVPVPQLIPPPQRLVDAYQDKLFMRNKKNLVGYNHNLRSNKHNDVISNSSMFNTANGGIRDRMAHNGLIGSNMPQGRNAQFPALNSDTVFPSNLQQLECPFHGLSCTDKECTGIGEYLPDFEHPSNRIENLHQNEKSETTSSQEEFRLTNASHSHLIPNINTTYLDPPQYLSKRFVYGSGPGYYISDKERNSEYLPPLDQMAHPIFTKETSLNYARFQANTVQLTKNNLLQSITHSNVPITGYNSLFSGKDANNTGIPSNMNMFSTISAPILASNTSEKPQDDVPTLHTGLQSNYTHSIAQLMVAQTQNKQLSISDWILPTNTTHTSSSTSGHNKGLVGDHLSQPGDLTETWNSSMWDVLYDFSTPNRTHLPHLLPNTSFSASLMQSTSNPFYCAQFSSLLPRRLGFTGRSIKTPTIYIISSLDRAWLELIDMNTVHGLFDKAWLQNALKQQQYTIQLMHLLFESRNINFIYTLYQYFKFKYLAQMPQFIDENKYQHNLKKKYKFVMSAIARSKYASLFNFFHSARNTSTIKNGVKVSSRYITQQEMGECDDNMHDQNGQNGSNKSKKLSNSRGKKTLSMYQHALPRHRTAGSVLLIDISGSIVNTSASGTNLAHSTSNSNSNHVSTSKHKSSSKHGSNSSNSSTHRGNSSHIHTTSSHHGSHKGVSHFSKKQTKIIQKCLVKYRKYPNFYPQVNFNQTYTENQLNNTIPHYTNSLRIDLFYSQLIRIKHQQDTLTIAIPTHQSSSINFYNAVDTMVEQSKVESKLLMNQLLQHHFVLQQHWVFDQFLTALAACRFEDLYETIQHTHSTSGKENGNNSDQDDVKQNDKNSVKNDKLSGKNKFHNEKKNLSDCEDMNEMITPTSLTSGNTSGNVSLMMDDSNDSSFTPKASKSHSHSITSTASVSPQTHTIRVKRPSLYRKFITLFKREQCAILQGKKALEMDQTLYSQYVTTGDLPFPLCRINKASLLPIGIKMSSDGQSNRPFDKNGQNGQNDENESLEATLQRELLNYSPFSSLTSASSHFNLSELFSTWILSPDLVAFPLLRTCGLNNTLDPLFVTFNNNIITSLSRQHQSLEKTYQALIAVQFERLLGFPPQPDQNDQSSSQMGPNGHNLPKIGQKSSQMASFVNFYINGSHQSLFTAQQGFSWYFLNHDYIGRLEQIRINLSKCLDDVIEKKNQIIKNNELTQLRLQTINTVVEQYRLNDHDANGKSDKNGQNGENKEKCIHPAPSDLNYAHVDDDSSFISNTSYMGEISSACDQREQLHQNQKVTKKRAFRATLPINHEHALISTVLRENMLKTALTAREFKNIIPPFISEQHQQLAQTISKEQEKSVKRVEKKTHPTQLNFVSPSSPSVSSLTQQDVQKAMAYHRGNCDPSVLLSESSHQRLNDAVVDTTDIFLMLKNNIEHGGHGVKESLDLVFDPENSITYQQAKKQSYLKQFHHAQQQQQRAQMQQQKQQKQDQNALSDHEKDPKEFSTILTTRAFDHRDNNSNTCSTSLSPMATADACAVVQASTYDPSFKYSSNPIHNAIKHHQIRQKLALGPNNTIQANSNSTQNVQKIANSENFPNSPNSPKPLKNSNQKLNPPNMSNSSISSTAAHSIKYRHLWPQLLHAQSILSRLTAHKGTRTSTKPAFLSLPPFSCIDSNSTTFASPSSTMSDSSDMTTRVHISPYFIDESTQINVDKADYILAQLANKKNGLPVDPAFVSLKLSPQDLIELEHYRFKMHIEANKPIFKPNQQQFTSFAGYFYRPLYSSPNDIFIGTPYDSLSAQTSKNGPNIDENDQDGQILGINGLKMCNARPLTALAASARPNTGQTHQNALIKPATCILDGIRIPYCIQNNHNGTNMGQNGSNIGSNSQNLGQNGSKNVFVAKSPSISDNCILSTTYHNTVLPYPTNESIEKVRETIFFRKRQEILFGKKLTLQHARLAKKHLLMTLQREARLLDVDEHAKRTIVQNGAKTGQSTTKNRKKNPLGGGGSLTASAGNTSTSTGKKRRNQAASTTTVTTITTTSAQTSTSASASQPSNAMDDEDTLASTATNAPETVQHFGYIPSPERYLTGKCNIIPNMILCPYQRNSKFINTHNRLQMNPYQSMWDDHFRNSLWSVQDQQTFTREFLKHPKNFQRISHYLPTKTVGECVNWYFYSKQFIDYKAMCRYHNIECLLTAAVAMQNSLNLGTHLSSGGLSGTPFTQQLSANHNGLIPSTSNGGSNYSSNSVFGGSTTSKHFDRISAETHNHNFSAIDNNTNAGLAQHINYLNNGAQHAPHFYNPIPGFINNPSYSATNVNAYMYPTYTTPLATLNTVGGLSISILNNSNPNFSTISGPATIPHPILNNPIAPHHLRNEYDADDWLLTGNGYMPYNNFYNYAYGNNTTPAHFNPLIHNDPTNPLASSQAYYPPISLSLALGKGKRNVSQYLQQYPTINAISLTTSKDKLTYIQRYPPTTNYPTFVHSPFPNPKHYLPPPSTSGSISTPSNSTGGSHSKKDPKVDPNLEDDEDGTEMAYGIDNPLAPPQLPIAPGIQIQTDTTQQYMGWGNESHDCNINYSKIPTSIPVNINNIGYIDYTHDTDMETFVIDDATKKIWNGKTNVVLTYYAPRTPITHGGINTTIGDDNAPMIGGARYLSGFNPSLLLRDVANIIKETNRFYKISPQNLNSGKLTTGNNGNGNQYSDPIGLNSSTDQKELLKQLHKLCNCSPFLSSLTDGPNDQTHQINQINQAHPNDPNDQSNQTQMQTSINSSINLSSPPSAPSPSPLIHFANCPVTNIAALTTSHHHPFYTIPTNILEIHNAYPDPFQFTHSVSLTTNLPTILSNPITQSLLISLQSLFFKPISEKQTKQHTSVQELVYARQLEWYGHQERVFNQWLLESGQVDQNGTQIGQNLTQNRTPTQGQGVQSTGSMTDINNTLSDYDSSTPHFNLSFDIANTLPISAASQTMPPLPAVDSTMFISQSLDPTVNFFLSLLHYHMTIGQNHQNNAQTVHNIPIKSPTLHKTLLRAGIQDKLNQHSHQHHQKQNYLHAAQKLFLKILGFDAFSHKIQDYLLRFHLYLQKQLAVHYLGRDTQHIYGKYNPHLAAEEIRRFEDQQAQIAQEAQEIQEKEQLCSRQNQPQSQLENSSIETHTTTTTATGTTHHHGHSEGTNDNTTHHINSIAPGTTAHAAHVATSGLKMALLSKPAGEEHHQLSRKITNTLTATIPTSASNTTNSDMGGNSGTNAVKDGLITSPSRASNTANVMNNNNDHKTVTKQRHLNGNDDDNDDDDNLGLAHHKFHHHHPANMVTTSSSNALSKRKQLSSAKVSHSQSQQDIDDEDDEDDGDDDGDEDHDDDNDDAELLRPIKKQRVHMNESDHSDDATRMDHNDDTDVDGDDDEFVQLGQ